MVTPQMTIESRVHKDSSSRLIQYITVTHLKQRFGITEVRLNGSPIAKFIVFDDSLKHIFATGTTRSEAIARFWEAIQDKDDLDVTLAISNDC